MTERATSEIGESGNLTPHRYAVLEVIRENHEHLTAGEIFIEARKRLGSISYATVYNSLRYLKEAGLVREIQFGNGASRYDREIERHDHAVCVHCGKLVDFDLPLGDELLKAAAEKTRFTP